MLRKNLELAKCFNKIQLFPLCFKYKKTYYSHSGHNNITAEIKKEQKKNNVQNKS